MTTDWNCLIHKLILAFMWRILFGRSLYRPYTDANGVEHPMDWNNKIRVAIYSDDHILSCTEDIYKVLTFENRAKCYAMLGFTLKRDDDRMSRDLEGHSFLGMTVQRQGGIFVPVFSYDRAVDGMLHAQRKEKDPAEQMQMTMDRAYSYLLLCAFNDRGWTYFHGLIKYAIAAGYPMPSGRHCIAGLDQVPVYNRALSRISAQNFWLGRESSGHGSRDISILHWTMKCRTLWSILRLPGFNGGRRFLKHIVRSLTNYKFSTLVPCPQSLRLRALSTTSNSKSIDSLNTERS
jgi:hypothetical protein